MSSNKIFKKERKHKKWQPYVKYLIIASIAACLVIGLISFFFFFKSVDYDIDNIVDVSTTAAYEANSEEETENTVSVKSLTGLSRVVFVVLNNSKEFDFCTLVSTDYDNQEMKIKTYDDIEYQNAYSEGISSLISLINKENESSVDKYAIFTYSSLRAFLSENKSYDIYVTDDINYHSESFILELSNGLQELNSEQTYKYLLISDNYTRSLILSDIINNLLTADNIDKFDDIYKAFANNTDNNISVIDFDNEADKLKIYAVAYDKFYPEAIV